jgi:hypothetical protein
MLVRQITIALLIAFASCTTVLGDLIVDGNVSDWGISISDGNASSFVVAPGVSLLDSHLEDQNDNAGNGGWVGPHQGGQNYDAEFMGVAEEDGLLYFLIVSGQRPDNGFQRYAPGDLRFETSAGTYGLEIGGGIGGGAGDALLSGDLGSTYQLNGNGYTTGYEDADALQTAGSLWSDVDWILDPISPNLPVQFAIGPQSTLAGQADYVFTRDTITDQHAVVELAVDPSWFGGAEILSAHWRPSCGNDELDVMVNVVPEPATASLLLIGMAAVVRRFRREK